MKNWLSVCKNCPRSSHYLFWAVTRVCCQQPRINLLGCFHVQRVLSLRRWRGAEIYTVPPGIPSRAPPVNFGSPAGCQVLTTILALVFDNSTQVVFHQLLFWFGSYDRNVSRYSAGINGAGDLLLLCNVTFQSVLGIRIMGCCLLFLLNFKGMHLLYGRSVQGVTLAWFCLEMLFGTF